MSQRHRPTAPATPAEVRCAIYTRKSSLDGFDQDFNSLDAQREAAQAYIHSQAHHGWVCLPDRYDDGGVSGSHMDRPALQRLRADVAAGKIDVVLVHRVDRLSRSLLDFVNLMEAFEQHGVSLVSVTQHFNSAQPMGRLTLNLLLSFAQFEREIIAERTRDKMAATRRKGKWSGGAPPLGFDLDPQSKRLLVNEVEAEQVRAIFALYLEYRALLPVVQELRRRGWLSKRWLTRRGQVRGGKPFIKTSLRQLLGNVLYVGQVAYRGEVHAGEQPALVDPATWQRVQALLRDKGRAGVRLRSQALLAGLLWCRPCGCAMTPSHAGKRGRRYRYYVCTNAQKCGWHLCPSKSVPAAAIERFVLEQVQQFQRDHLGLSILEADLATAATPHEQLYLVHRLVEQVRYDGAQGQVAISLRSPDFIIPNNIES